MRQRAWRSTTALARQLDARRAARRSSARASPTGGSRSCSARPSDAVRARRHALGIRPVFKRVDTCAAEFATQHRLPVLDLRGGVRGASRRDRKKIMVLGGGPNRIGQGIEFDYCCVHAALALREDGFETIMVNCNPETVSTDYDTSDRLYFEPLTLEDVLEIVDEEKPDGRDRAVRRADAAQARARPRGERACRSSAPRPDIDRRAPRTASASRSCCTSSSSCSRPTAPRATRRGGARAGARRSATRVVVRPELRARRARDGDRARSSATSSATCARR